MKPTTLTTQLNNRGGYVLVISLIMLGLLGLLGAVVMNLSGVDLQTAAYEKMSNWAFFSAESGVTQSRSDMQNYLSTVQSGQWPAADCTVVNGVMNVADCNINGNALNNFNIMVNNTPVNFSFSVVDFGAADDSTVLVTSTGTFQNVQQRVEAVIRYEPPDQTGAQECYTAKCSGVDQTSGTQVVNNVNSTEDIAVP